MSVSLAAVGSCKVELTARGYLVTRDGVPVPPQVHPPALLTFPCEAWARAFAAAIDGDDHEEAHRLIKTYGRWWA